MPEERCSHVVRALVKIINRRIPSGGRSKNKNHARPFLSYPGC